jgi:hypothetical protein
MRQAYVTPTPRQGFYPLPFLVAAAKAYHPWLRCSSTLQQRRTLPDRFHSDSAFLVVEDMARSHHTEAQSNLHFKLQWDRDHTPRQVL